MSCIPVAVDSKRCLLTIGYQATGRPGCGEKRGLDPAAARERVYQGTGCCTLSAEKLGSLRSGVEQEASGILEIWPSRYMRGVAKSYNTSIKHAQNTKISCHSESVSEFVKGSEFCTHVLSTPLMALCDKAIHDIHAPRSAAA